MNHSNITVSADLASLEEIAVWIDQTSETWHLPQKTNFAIHLCCEEGFSNVARHGVAQSNQAPAPVCLKLHLQDQNVILDIEDECPAFDPLSVAPPPTPTSLDEVKIGGLGVHLMKKFSEKIHYERHGDMNRLSIQFSLPQLLSPHSALA